MFVGPLLPVLGFVPFVFQYISTVAERYAYLALLGPALGAAVWLRGRGMRAYLVAGVVLAALGVRSAVQTRVWADEVTLFRHAVIHNPESYIGHQNLSYALYRSGQLPAAIEHARRAVAIAPHPPSWFHLGSLLVEGGQLDEAEALLKKALGGDPRHGRAHFALGLVAEQRRDRDRAVQHFRTAVELEPGLRPIAAEALARVGSMAPGASR
jgi:tetratricopeptide (TPR) repeat protein